MNSTVMPSLSPDEVSARHFSLDNAGVLGLLGGDGALSAMTTTHIYGNGRLLGWYNTPGAFQISKRLGSFAKLAPSCGAIAGDTSKLHSQSVHADPRSLLGLDACKGPKFRAAQSGTVIEDAGYLAALFLRECATWESEGRVVPGRRTRPVEITIADLGQAPAAEMRPAPLSVSIYFASLPIVASVGACALSALFEDWYASSLILVGILASGVSCLVLGSADLVFTHPTPAKGSPAGDGILETDKGMVVLRGSEGAVNAITRGSLSLRFAGKAHYSLVRWCSVLFFIQCISQLLLVPQASLFGQIMFLASLGVSALYNLWVSSLDKEKIHRKLLFERVLENPTLTKYTLGTRTAAVVFLLLVLRPRDPMGLLNELLPNDTPVWQAWKTTVVAWLHRLPSDKTVFEFGSDLKAQDGSGFTQEEADLLGLLYGDARAAYNGYKDYLRCDSL